MNHTLLIAEALTVGSALSCAIRLYRLPSGKTNARLPVISILIIGVTALITGLQFFFPEILSAFRRDWEAFRAGEWWRMVTPLFVQAYGWKQCCFNAVAALIFFPLAEKFYGKRLLALYFIPGLVGEAINYVWSPNGAGSSLGIYGVMGGLFAFVCRHRREIPWPMIGFAISGLGGAIVLSLNREGHGPALLTGALVASMLRTRLRPVPDVPADKSLPATAAAPLG